ncbi:MAG: hypothetical protein EKK47_11175 [Burkholderiales bacterium]|nr:MAG: hypothetical protein EKK47_11175 [Burkholderiales bacterium]
MTISEDQQDLSTVTDKSPEQVSPTPPKPKLHLQFLDLAMDPLPGLNVRITIGAQDKIYTTDTEGKVDDIQASAGVRLRIAIQRFDGSYKLIEEAPMPANESTWNYISPQLVLETETELHEGNSGEIERSIPKASSADEGNRPQPDFPKDPSTASETVLEAKQSTAIDVATAPTTQAPTPKTKPNVTAPAPRASPIKPAKQPTISGSNAPLARQSAQTKGRTPQGAPMAVLTARILDWWNSWTLPTLNLWPQHGGSTQTPVSKSSELKPTGHGSKVAYSASMLPKVQALIQFAQAQTEFEYGKGEGTASVVAQMAKKQFKHVPGEKDSDASRGRCYQYVRIALTRAGFVDGFLADTSSASVQASASLAGQPLLDKGFVDVTDEVPDARWAAAGDVIVYSWSAATWAKRKKKYGTNTPNHGHIDIRSEGTYISDFIPAHDHPEWKLTSSDSQTGFEPGYVNIHIYRKYYDPRPTCRIRAFLACLREYEAQAIRNDTDRYRALNTPLPGASNQKSFRSYATHPWSKFPKSSWPEGTSTASGAYQCTLDTVEGFIKQRMLFDLEGQDLFTPTAQDRLAVMLMEEKGALPAVRKGDLDSAVKALLSTWTSLPGAAQNHGRKTVDGKPMDMTYLRSIYARFLSVELGKFGIAE